GRVDRGAEVGRAPEVGHALIVGARGGIAVAAGGREEGNQDLAHGDLRPPSTGDATPAAPVVRPPDSRGGVLICLSTRRATRHRRIPLAHGDPHQEANLAARITPEVWTQQPRAGQRPSGGRISSRVVPFAVSARACVWMELRRTPQGGSPDEAADDAVRRV